MVIVYYRESIQIKITHRKKHVGQRQGNAKYRASDVFFTVESDRVIFLAPVCDSAWKDMPIRKANSSLCVQSFLGSLLH